jgi:acetoin utilization deacetylase AcuC-like enzyme
MNVIGYVTDNRMLLHKEDHQFENPERIISIHKELENRGYLNLFTHIESRLVDRSDLLLAHDESYVDYMEQLFTREESEIKKVLARMDSVFGNKHSLLCAKVAVGCTLNLMKAVLSEQIKHGIANVRSPGHHSSRNNAEGFCFFNNVAIASKYAIKCGKRVAIVDWDLHFGDGTYDIMKSDQDSLFININKYDHGQFWPGTGKDIHTNNVLSIGLNTIGTDDIYYKLFNDRVMPKISSFNPDIIIISAGFDCASGDPLGDYQLSSKCYYNLTKMLLSFGKPTLLVLEGGYNLEAISKAMVECARALLENFN